ncbi:Inner membrane protein YqjF [Acaryochloris thomasi RCC1774]|uniref:Inner membrane protein YqjF n=1 Tax=Acaryochloris thomasi RCC1774 TaxID=1764569 RepID=A0A2W1K1X0_9CYAN|nr:DoxX family protein [Acaryochloris thomasi]PZD75414.1 Inner membrane protein YqjF [Acaryochloris thomasi RCC1774]
MKYIPLAARICLCIIFINSGIGKIFDFASTAEMMANKGLPIASILLVFTIIFQLLGGLSLLLGYKVKLGSILLISFLIPATLVFHNPIADPGELNSFLKNIGLIGGLLMVVYAGAGALSIDNLAEKSQPREQVTINH